MLQASVADLNEAYDELLDTGSDPDRGKVYFEAQKRGCKTQNQSDYVQEICDEIDDSGKKKLVISLVLKKKNLK